MTGRKKTRWLSPISPLSLISKTTLQTSYCKTDFYISPRSYATSVIWTCTNVQNEMTVRRAFTFYMPGAWYLLFSSGKENVWSTYYYPHFTDEVIHVSNNQVTSQVHTAIRNGARIIIFNLLILSTTSYWQL